MKYYIDRLDVEEKVSASNVFVVTGEDNGIVNFYAPIGQHGEIKDKKYLDECTEITKEEYIKYSNNFYTPVDYL